MGTIYLLHFHEPIGNINSKGGYAQHYTGWTNGSLLKRLELHRQGKSDVKIMTALHVRGIGFDLARTWKGDRTRERAIKRQGGAKRFCPMCGIKPRALTREMEQQ